MFLDIVEANIFYGRQRCPVDVDSELLSFLPINCNNWVEAVLRAMAIVSNASGGHTLGHREPASERFNTDAHLIIDVVNRYALLTGSGFSVRWGTERVKAPQLADCNRDIPTYARAMDEYLRTLTHHDVPYIVTSTQYGNGWEHPKIVSYFDHNKRLNFKGLPCN